MILFYLFIGSTDSALAMCEQETRADLHNDVTQMTPFHISTPNLDPTPEPAISEVSDEDLSTVNTRSRDIPEGKQNTTTLELPEGKHNPINNPSTPRPRPEDSTTPDDSIS